MSNNTLTQWQVEHGPFDESRFSDLPKTHWSLLVQAVDHFVPDIRDLLKHFQFLPSWRVDDIMVSFAPEGGGVGPHYDQYDVFLIQLSGQREWRLGQVCDDNTPTVKDQPVRILEQFNENERWLMNPGDVLYVPPAHAHWGTAMNDCITLSVGFRAPAVTEVVSDLGHYLSEHISDFNRYSDQGISDRSSAPHEIQSEDIERLADILTTLANDKTQLTHWLAKYMTAPKYETAENTEEYTVDDFNDQWQSSSLFRNPQHRLAYADNTLYFDGKSIKTQLTAAQLHKLCDGDTFDYTNDQGVIEVMLTLTNNDVLYFDD